MATEAQVQAWLQARGWQAFGFQREVWAQMAAGRSGLLHASTGAGKTLAVWLGALQALPGDAPAAGPLSVLWVTPMRALSHDTLLALQDAARALAPGWTLAARTGDTSSSERSAQQKRWPTGLVTTPESLSLLLARADAPTLLKRVRLVVVDEWHELLGSKRGVQLQLALARLRRWHPGLMTWGLSATLANLDEARDSLAPDAVQVQGARDKVLTLDTLLPPKVERFAWAGHMGLTMRPAVVARIEAAASTLVFTNTRSQAERWFQALLEARPDWAGLIALHHGSLDAEARRWVEAAMKEGRLKAVVCTASLDLGVDFLPVEQVLQIGSAKGVARLMQRAGRSGHAPGRASRVTLVPTHSWELVEASALRAALQAGQIEPRRPPQAPLDVLVQHLVTVALGGGFRPDELLAEVRSAPAYRGLSDAAWAWALAFVRHGGESLRAYPDFQRVVPDADGVWRVPDARLARRHRSNIGTIVSDAAMSVQFLTGGRIATVEESFIARLRAGDVFLLGGRTLELVRTEGLTAYVRLARSGRPCCRAGPAASCPSPTPWPRPCWNAWPPPRAARRPMPRCRRCSPCCSCRPPGRPCPRRRSCWPRRCARPKATTSSSTPCRPHGAPGPGLAAGLAPGARDPGHLHDGRQRLRPGAAERHAHGLGHRAAARPGPGRAGRAARGGARQPERRRAGAPALSRDRPHQRPDLPEPPGRGAQPAAAAGFGLAVLRGLPPARPGQPPAAAGRGRAAEPGTGGGPAGPQPAHAAAAACSCRCWFAPARWPCR
jgi:replicative superfamily II helicase